MKFHLCIDCRLIEAAGIGTYLRASLAELALTKKYKLSLLSYVKDFPALQCFSDLIIPMESKIYSLHEQFEYIRKIPRCDLFWTPHFNVPWFPIRAKKRITTINDVYHLAHRDQFNRLQRTYAKIAYNAAFRLSHYVVTISQFSKSEILKYASLKPKNLIVVPCPFHFDNDIKIKKEPFILTVGNVKSHKNLLRLVKAYAEVRPKERLWIVGRREGLIHFDKKLFAELENDSFLKHHVTFTGYVTQMRLKELYSSAKLFVFPSTYEGFGYPPLEAMASGCPVVASNAASIPEVCLDAVEYVNPYSISSIAEGIQYVLNSPQRREELILKGWALIQEKRAMNHQIAEVIDACCYCP